MKVFLVILILGTSIIMTKANITFPGKHIPVEYSLSMPDPA